MAQFYFPAMAVQVALVAFCCLLDFGQCLLPPLQQPTCILTGLSCSNPVQATFFRFYRSVSDYTDVYKNNWSALTTAPGFDLQKSTTFFIHGWTEHVNKSSGCTIASAYTTVKEENIVSYDWSIYSVGNYPDAASKVKVAANEFLDAIQFFTAAGLKPESIKLLGFSLGGQMVGAIGNMYQERHNKTLRHITALDPAFPYFFPLNNNLKESSGDFVSVIHTTSGLAGYPAPIGHVDFVPNFGIVPQSPCVVESVETVFEIPGTTWETASSMTQLAIVCDHHCAWRYYAESVLKKDAYTAVCIDSEPFCRFGNDTAIMGYATPNSARGIYYIDVLCPDTKHIYDPAAN